MLCCHTGIHKTLIYKVQKLLWSTSQSLFLRGLCHRMTFFYHDPFLGTYAPNPVSFFSVFHEFPHFCHPEWPGSSISIIFTQSNQLLPLLSMNTHFHRQDSLIDSQIQNGRIQKRCHKGDIKTVFF